MQMLQWSDDDWDRFDDDLAAHMAAQLLDTDPPGTMREAKVGSSVPTPEPPASAIEILSVTLEASDWWATPSLTQVEDPPTEPPVPVVTVQPVPEPVNERPETPKGRLGSAVLLAFVALAGLALRVASSKRVDCWQQGSQYACVLGCTVVHSLQMAYCVSRARCGWTRAQRAKISRPRFFFSTHFSRELFACYRPLRKPRWTLDPGPRPPAGRRPQTPAAGRPVDPRPPSVAGA